MSTSRRNVLARGLYAIAGAAVAGTAILSRSDSTQSAAATSPTTADSGAAAASAAGPLTMSMYVRDVRFTNPGLKPGKLPDFGSTMSPKGRLESPAGDHLGRFSSGILPGSDGQVAVQRFTFSDGSLIGMGSGDLNGEEYAVVGGTGRFAGAIGSYVVTLHAGRSGRDAAFAISLTGTKG